MDAYFMVERFDGPLTRSQFECYPRGVAVCQERGLGEV